MEDNLKKLYDTISASYTLPEYDIFKTDMQDDTKLRALYDNISSSYELPEFDVFQADMGVKKKEPGEVPPLISKDGQSEQPKDYIGTVENLQESFRERQPKTEPVSYEETLAQKPLVTEAARASNKKSDYNKQRIEEFRGTILKDIEDFATKLNAEYAEKGKKDGADSKALEEERYWKGQQFVAAKQAEMEKEIDKVYDPDQYEFLGMDDVSALKKQIGYIASQPMEYEQREKAYDMLQSKFMSKLSGLPEEYVEPIRKEVNDIFSRYSLMNDKGEISMYAWKKETNEKLSEIQANKDRVVNDFKEKYPDFEDRMVAQPGGTFITSPIRTEGKLDQQFWKDYNQYKQDLILFDTSREKLSRIMKFPDMASGFETPFIEGGRDLLASVSSAGYSDIAKALEEGAIAQKVQNGEELSAGERALFDSKAIFDSAAGEIEDSAGRKLGRVVAQGIPFVEQMAMMGLTGFGGNLGISTLKEAAKKEGIKLLSSQGLPMIAKEAGKLLATSAKAAPLMPVSWTRQQEGMAGKQKLDKEGTWTIDKPTVEGWLEATYKGLATGGTEYLSESIGAYLPISKVFGNIQKVTGVNFKLSPAVTDILRTAKIQGIPEEIMEELFNIPVQGVLIGDEPLSEVTWKDVWDTVWTTAGFTAILGGTGTIGGTVDGIRRKRNYQVINMFGKDNVAAVRDAVIAGDKVQWIKAIGKAMDGKTKEDLGMSPTKAANRLAQYAQSVAQETALITQKIAAMPEDGIAGEPLPEIAPAGEQETQATALKEIEEIKGEDLKEEIGGIENAESTGVKTEEAGAAEAPAVVEGEEERLRVQRAAEDRVEAPKGEVIERRDNGDVLMYGGEEEADLQEAPKEDIIAEIKRLNDLSKGQKVIAIEGGMPLTKMVGIEDSAEALASVKSAMAEFGEYQGLRGLHMKGDKFSYINVDRVRSVEAARKVWLHEAGIHGGMERLFDTKEAYEASVLGVVKHLGGRKGTIDAISELGGNPIFYAMRKDSELGEEYLAFLSRKIISDPDFKAERVLSKEELGLWQRFVKAIKDAAARFMGAPLDLTEADIANLIIDSTRMAMGEKGAAPAFRGAKQAGAKAMATQAEEKPSTQIFAAPLKVFESSGLEDRTPFEAPEYKALLKTLEDVASTLGLPTSVAKQYMGLWAQGGDVSFEGSAMVTLETVDPVMVDFFSALAGSLAWESQNSIMRVRYEQGAEGKMYQFEMKDAASAAAIVEDIRKLLAKPEYSDGQGASFDVSKNILYLGVEKESDLDKFNDIIEKHKDEIRSRKVADAAISFLGKGEYQGILRKNWDTLGGQYRGDDRQNFDNLVRKALGKLERDEVSDAIKVAAESLKLTFPNVGVIVAENNNDAITQATKYLVNKGWTKNQVLQATRGIQYSRGLAVFKGREPILVIIDKKVAEITTAAHEMWHLILGQAFASNPGKLREFAIAIDSVLRDSGRKDIADELKSFADSYNTDESYEEYIAQFGGMLAASNIDINALNPRDKTLLEKIKEIINKIAKALTGNEVFLKDATPENILDFMTAISGKIARGESVAEYLVEGQALPGMEGVAAKRHSIPIMKGEESLKKYGLSKGANTVRRVGEALQARQRAKYGMIGRNDRSEVAQRKIAAWMVKEISYWTDLCGQEDRESGRGWYGKLYQEALDAMSEAFPRLKTDQNARDMFTLLAAITSDGQKIMHNFQMAAQAYQKWEKTGRVPNNLPSMRNASISGNLRNINELLDAHGGDIAKIKEYLLRTDTVSNINKELKKRGLSSMKWPADFKVPVAACILGPKLGMYFANLSGMENYPTLDRWWSRMFNRYRGTLIPAVSKGFTSKGEPQGLDRFKVLLGNPSMTDEEALLAVHPFQASYAAKKFKRGTEIEVAANTIYKNAYVELNDQPFNTSDRGFMYDALKRAVKNINRQGYAFTMADAQAVLWYYEKNLYKELGVRANIEGISYADAAKETVRKYHEAGDKFNYKIEDNEDSSFVEGADEDILEEEIIIRRQVISEGGTEDMKRLKAHIRKMVLRAHGINLEAKRVQQAYDIGVAEERLIRDIEAGKQKATLKRVADTYKQISTFISRALTTAPFATKLNRIQTRTLVNEARRVKALDSLQDFFMVLDRIVDNTEYSASLAEAHNSQKEIRKRVSAGRYGKHAQFVLNFATMPVRARDFDIDALKEFNKVAGQLLSGKVPVEGINALLEYYAPEISETAKVGLRKLINDMEGPEGFEKVYDAIAALKVDTVEKLERAMNAIGAARERLSDLNLDEDTLGEMDDRLTELENLLVDNAAEIAEEIEAEKQAIISEGLRVLKGEIDQRYFADEVWLEVKKMMNMTRRELSLMTPKQIFMYREIMYGLTQGFINKEMYNFIQEMDVTQKKSAWKVVEAHLQAGYTKIRELGDKLARKNMGVIARWIDPLRMNEAFLTNAANLSKMNVIDQKLLGIYDRNVRPIYETYIIPLTRAITNMDRDVENAMNRYWAASKKVNKTKRELLGMLMAEKDFRSGTIVIGTEEYTWDTLPAEEKKDLFRWVIENMAGKTRYDIRDLIELRKEMVLDKDGNIDIDASQAKLFKDAAVARLATVAREVIDSQKGKARVATEMRGDVWEDEGPAYFPRMVTETLRYTELKDHEIGRIEQMTSPYRAVRKRAKSTFNRTHERHATEFNLDKVIGFYVHDVNRDYHLSRPLTSVSMALNRVATTSEVADADKIAGAIRKSIVDRVKVEMAERSRMPLLSRAISWKRTLSLAQPERPIIEFTANALRYQIENPGADIRRLADTRWKQVARMMSSPLSLKRLSRWGSEELEEQRETVLERGAKILYTAADTYAGRFVYANEFEKAFNEKTGKKFDIDAFLRSEDYRNENKEALNHADAMSLSMIESLYNSQSWATTPSRHKYVPGSMEEKYSVSKKSFVAQTLGYMQSFNFGETEEAMNAIRALVRPGLTAGAKAQAGRRLLNLMATNYIYMSLRGLVFVALNAAIDDEDDMLDAISNYFSPKNQFKMFLGSVSTLGMGRYGGLMRTAISVAMGFADYSGVDKQTMEFIANAANQSINARPLSPNKRMSWVDFLDQTGIIWGDISADLARMYMTGVDVVKQVQEKGFDSLTFDQKETYVALSAFNQMLAFALPNFFSPVTERVIRAYMYNVGPDYEVDPDEKARTIGGIDIKKLYDLDAVSGIREKKLTVYSSGERGDSMREMSDSDMKKYQMAARNNFDAYVREYTRTNGMAIRADNQAGTVLPSRSDEVQKEINALWSKAKMQARYELYEYPSARNHPEFKRVVEYGALPEPVKTITRTIEGKSINILMQDRQLAGDINRTYIKMYLDWFAEQYPTEAAVKRAKEEVMANGDSRLDNEINEALSELRARAKGQHITGK